MGEGCRADDRRGEGAKKVIGQLNPEERGGKGGRWRWLGEKCRDSKGRSQQGTGNSGRDGGDDRNSGRQEAKDEKNSVSSSAWDTVAVIRASPVSRTEDEEESREEKSLSREQPRRTCRQSAFLLRYLLFFGSALG